MRLLGILLGLLCLCTNLNSSVINVTVLEKKVQHRPAQKVYFISNRHLRSWSLPGGYSQEFAR